MQHSEVTTVRTKSIHIEKNRPSGLVFLVPMEFYRHFSDDFSPMCTRGVAITACNSLSEWEARGKETGVKDAG